MKVVNIECEVCKVATTSTRIRSGALACSACKRFFNRQRSKNNNGKNINLKCRQGKGQCLDTEMNKSAEKSFTGLTCRRMCAACRFKKCLQIGMNPEKVIKEDNSTINHQQPTLANNNPPVNVEFTAPDSPLLPLLVLNELIAIRGFLDLEQLLEPETFVFRP